MIFRQPEKWEIRLFNCRVGASTHTTFALPYADSINKETVMLRVFNSRKQLYPLIYYGLLMPLISGVVMGLFTGFSFFTGEHHFVVELMSGLYWIGIWIVGAYAFGGCTACITGLVASILVNKNIAKWKFLFITIISAVCTSFLILFLIIDFKKPFNELMMIWSILSTIITTLLYFKTKNFHYFTNKG